MCERSIKMLELITIYPHMFQVPELERGHEWDWHQPGDIERLESLL